MRIIRSGVSKMMKEVRPASGSHDKFITSCGGIQPGPLLPPSDEDAHFYDPTLAGNERIEEVIHLFYQDQTPELFTAICLAIREQMAKDRHFIFPADITEDEDGNTVFSFKTLDLEIGAVLPPLPVWKKRKRLRPPALSLSSSIPYWNL